MSTKSRRSKKTIASKATTVPGGTENATVVDDDQNISLAEQLDRALVAVTSSQEQTLKLHHAWRSQLQRISILVLVVILTQVKAPGSACMTAVQQWNDKMELHNNVEDRITSGRTLALMAQDSVMEGMSFFCSLCLVLWVSYSTPSTTEFSNLFFRVASALLPLIVYTYSQDRQMGCLRKHAADDPYPDGNEDVELEKRPFPVVLIFYIVTTLSMLAMKVQRSSGEENIRKVQQLKQDLMQSKKKT